MPIFEKEPNGRRSVLVRLYSALLALYPRRLREEREEMTTLFADLLRRERERGRARVAVFVAVCVADVLFVGLPARLFELLGITRRSGTPKQRSLEAPRGDRLLPSLALDLHYALRYFRRQRIVSITAIASLALGIAVATAIFSLFDAVMLRPVAVAQPERLVAMTSLREHGINTTFPYPDFRVVREATAGSLAMVAYSSRPTAVKVTPAADGATERLFVGLASHDYFRVLGVGAQRGSVFDEGSASGDHFVAVLAHAFWRSRLAADPEAIGRTIEINGQPVTIMGIAPPGFHGLDGNGEPALWMPIEHQPVLSLEDYVLNPRNGWLYWAGVLEPGVSVEAAQDHVEAASLAHWGAVGRDWELGIQLQHVPTGYPIPLLDYQPYLRLAMALVLLVLLIAAANVAGLLLAAGTGRRQEIAARCSLGAGRLRLARQLLTESLLLGIVAGATGVALAVLLVRALLRIEPLASELAGLNVGLDGRVLGFALLATLVVSVLFGLAPVLQLARGDMTVGLRDSGGSGAHRRLFGQRTLVVAQIAMSFTLLVQASLFVVSLRRLQQIDPGIERAPMLLASIDLRAAGYDAEPSRSFYQALLEQVGALPGVESAAVARTQPVNPAGSRMSYEVSGYQPRASDDMELDTNFVSMHYFETLGIAVEEGRTFEQRDVAPTAEPVAVVNRVFAERFWPGQQPIGRTIEGLGVERRVVGVVQDGKYRSLRESPRPIVYLAHEREAARLGMRMTLFTRTEKEPLGVLSEVRGVVQRIDPRVPLYGVITLEEHLRRAVAGERLTSLLLGGLAGFAMVLAGIGLFALLSYWIRLRRPEIGIRLALGARPRDVWNGLALLILRLVALGCLLGAALALPLGQLLEAQLYGIAHTNPGTYLLGAVLLLLVGAIAGILPTRQATGVDPMTVLRHD